MRLGFRCKSLIPLLLVLAFGCPLFGGKEFLAGPRDRVATDQLLVRLRRGADIGQILSALAPRAGARLISTQQNTYLLTLPPGSQAAISRLLAAHALVDYVEPNHIRSISVVPPNDSMYPSQWNLTNINAVQAWSYFPDQYLTSITAGTNRVKVGILDTGADCTHPDFKNAGGTSTDSAHGGQLLWASSEAINATTISSPPCPWADDNGHGTHVAGILAATTGNGVGVASLGFPLQLIVIKTNDHTGQATDSQVATGMYDAITAGAQVISMSLGGPGYSQTLQTAMDYAWAHNVLVIAAGGNFGNNDLVYPGDGNHVLGVGATDSNNVVAGFSSYGNGVKIAAPGVGILSTLPTYSGAEFCCNYGTLSGTSMATPHVAALAGLLFAANPGISAAAVAQRIQQTAQSPNSGWDQHIGYGVINAGAALGNFPAPFTQGALTGQVTDTFGIPLSGAVVTAGSQTFTTAPDANSGDDDGLFRINLNPGTYSVSVAMAGYSTVNMQVVVVAGADTMVTVPMGGSLGEFSGTVTYNSVGVAGATVEAVSSGTPSTIQGTAVTDSSGNYTIYVPPGSYTLTASAPNYVNTTSGSQPLSVNGTVTVNLALTALGNIVGTVTDVNSNPVAGAHIDFANSSFSGGAVTAANGTYSTYGLPSGTYTVTASASGYTSVSIGSVSVTTSTSTLVNLQFSTGIALSNGLLANWPFNEGSGSTAFDSSGNAYNAALSNTTWTSGLLYPSALSFNGSNSSGTTPAIPFTNTFSMSVWLHPASTSQGSSAPIVQAQSGSWWFGIDQTGAKYKFIVNSGSGSSGDCAYTNVLEGCAQSGPIGTGWHMLTGTYDGTTAILYLDGALVASDTATAKPSASSIVEIGQNWNGALQSLRLYNRALTASEVLTLFSQQATLTLTKTADAATVSAGNAIGYTLSVSNSGSGTATSAALSDVLPTGTGISWSISPSYSGPGTCSIASGTLSCSLGSLSAGATSSVHVTSATTTSSCGAYPNTASSNATNTGTVQASATITVTCTQTINFGTLSNKVYGTAPFTVSAAATSNLAVAFNSQMTSVCTVSGNTVTIVAGGMCTIQATQSGNAYYSAATASQSFTVTPASQSITFNGLPNQVYGAAPFTVSAVATSGLAVSFNSSTTLSVCTMSGNTVTIVGGGTCTVQATQTGSANYSAATPVSQSFAVTPASQSITFNALPSKVYGAAPFTVSATATSNLAVSFNSSTTLSVCTMSGSTVTIVGGGMCTVQATQTGNANYAAATPVNQSFIVTPESQSITFNALPSKVYGAAPFTVSATATSNLAVSFNSSTTLSVCTISGNTVTLVGAGTCTVQATQSGNTNYSAAAPVSQSFTVTSANQTITFNSLSNQVYGAVPFTVTASATSGLAVSFNSSTTLSVCTVSGTIVTIVGGGTCTIQATQSGNTTYSAAAPVSQSFNVTPASQTITFNTLSNQSLGAAPFPVSATSSSNLAVSFSSQTTSICTMSGSTVTLVAIGTCTIQATQSGNANYATATPVSQGFMVTGGIVITGVNSLNFPNTVVGKSSAAQAFTLQNSGNSPLTIASITPAGTDAANYRYTADAVHPCPTSPATLGAGAMCMLDIAFAPVSQGSHNSAQIVITDNSGNVSGTTQSIAVTGTGIVLSSIAVSAGSSSLTYGSTGQFTATGTYSDNSTADVTGQVTWASSATGVATISAGGLATPVAAGQANITATLSALTSNSFQLTVLPGTAASISVFSGSGQSTTVGTSFGGMLVAAVKDSGGNAVANASVTFTAPSSGASATFSNSANTYTTTTNSSGIATSLALIANSTAGSYSVTAAVTGVTTAAVFSLTNLKVSNLTVTESVTTLVQGQSSVFTLTVADAANAGPTSGAVTIMLSVPIGLTLTGLNGGATWNCNISSASCTTNAVLSPGSTTSISVTVSVALNAQGPVSIGSGISGGTATTYLAPILSACAISGNASISVTDVQQIVNQALGVSSPVNDLSGDGLVNVVDLQIVVNAAMNQGCSAS